MSIAVLALEILAKSLFLAALALLVEASLPKTASSLKAAVTGTGLLACLLLSAIALFLPHFSALDLPLPTNLAPLPQSTVASASSRSFVHDESSLQSLPTLLVLLWAAPAMFLILRLTLGLLELRRLEASSTPVHDMAWTSALESFRKYRRLARPVEMRVSSEISAPISFEVRKSIIVIDWESSRRPELAYPVITHELAHTVRYDWLLMIVSRLACALLWFNPLVWILQRKLRSQIEFAADDLALTCGLDKINYADSLLAIAKRQLRAPAASVSIVARTAHLSERVAATLDQVRHRKPMHVVWTLALLVFCGISAGALGPASISVSSAKPATSAAGSRTESTLAPHQHADHDRRPTADPRAWDWAAELGRRSVAVDPRSWDWAAELGRREAIRNLPQTSVTWF